MKDNTTRSGRGIQKSSNRKNRRLPFLDASAVALDDRTVSDLLTFVYQYSKEIRFYGPGADADSRWDVFFEQDLLVILLRFSRFDLDPIEAAFEKKVRRLKGYFDDAQGRDTINAMVLDLLVVIRELRDLKNSLAREHQAFSLARSLRDAFSGGLRDYVGELYRYGSILDWSNDTEEELKAIVDEWGSPKKGRFKKRSLKRMDTVRIRKFFNSFFFAVHELQVKSRQLLEKILNDSGDNKPHIALIVGFLNIYGYVQREMNNIPAKHLNYYYKEILKFQPRSLRPDKAFLHLGIKEGVKSAYVSENALLSAGKNDKGEDIFYKCDTPAGLTDSRIVEIRNIYPSRNERHHKGLDGDIVTAIFFDQKERGDGMLFEAGDFPVFGVEPFADIFPKRKPRRARSGFIIESDAFNLVGGERKIILALNCAPHSFRNFLERLIQFTGAQSEQDHAVRKSINHAFRFTLSTPDGGLEIVSYQSYIDSAKSRLRFEFDLSAEVGIIGPGIDPVIEQDPYCEKAHLSATLRYESKYFLYSFFSGLEILGCEVGLQVEGLPGLGAGNRLSDFVPEEPFQPFGPIPEEGSYLIIGSSELVGKKVSDISLRLDWETLPKEKSLASYFRGYNIPVSDDDYRLEIFVRDNREWVKKLEVPLQNENAKGERIVFRKHLVLNGLQSSVFTSDKPDAIKIRLKAPELAFGHKYYASALSDVLLYNSKYGKKLPKEQPKAPLVPALNKVRLSYRSVERLDFENEASFYHLSVFGYRKNQLRKGLSTSLLYQEKDSPSFMMALDKIPENKRLDLFFQIKESPQAVVGVKRNLNWYAMDRNNWRAIGTDMKLGDTSNGFLNTGFVRLRLSGNMTSDNTLMGKGRYWIMATSEKADGKRPERIERIYENVLSVEWNGDGSGEHLKKGLPAGQIEKFVEQPTGVSSVMQIGKTFGGLGLEGKGDFQQRVSERLRHKNRALMAVDYEQLVLENFPEVGRVKCFTADMHDGKVFVPPGKLRIVPMPIDLSPERPYLKQECLLRIRDFIRTKTSPFVDVQVSNPVFEAVRISASVSFTSSHSDGFLVNRVKETVKSFIETWRNPDLESEIFGNPLFGSELLTQIQALPYVQFVTSFSMYKISEKETGKKLFDTAREEQMQIVINPEYPWSILCCSDSLDLRVMASELISPPESRGIQNMQTDDDFVIE
ncbi:hypothetical protein FUAX_18440 [Fulvitalea axinellae]|uniref:Baseplate protein J-like domain-containing protein n=1 Tax=Fulvitalea axinellae TaxID=1182444 RepID=A0AAU9CVD7_9BACT|nr:hypothetical protein FUAX_18440 [Fulvitalea axinellae]